MKIFVDTAQLDEIEKAFSWGIVDGVTTNPSLIKKAVDSLKGKGKNIDMESYIEKILKTAKNTPVSLEVIGLTENEMYEQAKKLYEKFNAAGNVVIKIPINPSIEKETNTRYDGLKVIYRLSKETILSKEITPIPVNCTLIMAPEQALLAAKAGAKYVSPFAGRIDDYLRTRENLRKGEEIKIDKSEYYPAEGMRNVKRDLVHEEAIEELIHDNGIVSGVDLVSKTVQILRNYGLETEVIAASVRNPRQAREFALAGAHIATIPFDVLEKMLEHEKTREGVRDFTKDIVPEYAEIFKK